MFSTSTTPTSTSPSSKGNEFTGISLGDSETTDRALRIVADHARGMAFLIADGVRPGNQHREYVLRRIIRRAMLQAYSRLGMSPGQLAGLAEVVVDYMGDFYEELRSAREDIRRIVTGEATRFVEIYESGMSLLASEIERMRGGNFPGDVAFMLHDTYGFPVEVTREVLAERDLSLDEAGFEAAMDAQRERAREAMRGYERVVAAFRDQEIRSRFVGYEREQVETRIVAVEPVPDAEGRSTSYWPRTRSTPPVAGRWRTRVGSPRRTDSSRSSMRSRRVTIRCSGQGSNAVRFRPGTR